MENFKFGIGDLVSHVTSKYQTIVFVVLGRVLYESHSASGSSVFEHIYHVRTEGSPTILHYIEQELSAKKEKETE